MIDIEAHEAAEAARRAAAMVDGKHYSAHVKAVKALRRAGRDDEAGALLVRLVEAVERESAVPLAGHISAPPWYHAQLAAIHVKAGNAAAADELMQRLQRVQAEATRSGTEELSKMRAAAAHADKPPRKARPKRSAQASDPAASSGLAALMGGLAGALFKRRR